jgi:hypothetical protein
VLGAGDWSARVRVARRLLAQAWLPTPAGWLAFRTPSLPLPPLRLPRPRLPPAAGGVAAAAPVPAVRAAPRWPC